MTIRDLLEKVDVKPLYRTLIRAAIPAAWLDKKLSVEIDEELRLVRGSIDGEEVVCLGFEEIRRQFADG